MKVRILRCNKCGQIVTVVKDTNLPVMCCMADMEELVANKEDATVEKHVPKVTCNGNCVEVQIGEELHPAEQQHYIVWVLLVTDKGTQRKCIDIGKTPKVSFYIAEDEKVEAVYSYCNIHGLWCNDKCN